MSRRDFIHVAVREALENGGWEITDDPLLIELEFDEFPFQIDIGAEKLIKASKNKRQVAIEVKSFKRFSTISDFHTALGQYLNYRDAIELGDYPHELYLGVGQKGYDKLIASYFIRMQLIRYTIKIVIIDTESKKIIKWTALKNISKL